MIQRRTPLKRTALKRKVKPRPTLDELKESGALQKASSFTSKPRKKLKPRSPKNKGWVDVALALWNKEGNERCCEVCGIHLGEDFSPAWYHHLWHRGSHPSLKREPKNLAQLCLLHHDWAHKHGGPMNLEKNGMLRKEYRAAWSVLAKRMRDLIPVNSEPEP